LKEIPGLEVFDSEDEDEKLERKSTVVASKSN
jgi:hypothetical protein